jgi:archaellum biogenesis ATPase FlaH
MKNVATLKKLLINNYMFIFKASTVQFSKTLLLMTTKISTLFVKLKSRSFANNAVRQKLQVFKS